MSTEAQPKSVEELLEDLKEQGIPVGAWQNQRPQGDAEAFTIPSFVKLAEGLEQLKGLISDQVQKDQTQIAELHMKLNRHKHGGGH